MRHITLKKSLSITLALILTFNVVACGTLLHPERKEQSHSGKMDAKIVVLDAVGLLFFLIPGIIAFYVDHDNGTLYLPEGSTTHKIQLDKSDMSLAAIEKAVENHLGRDIDLNDSAVQVSRMDRLSEAEIQIVLQAHQQSKSQVALAK